jgi:hypothetical protein
MTGTSGAKRRGAWWIAPCAGTVMAFAAGASGQLSVGPDVTYADCVGTMNYGAVNGIRGYALGSYTCNMGNANLQWLSRGTPALAMNAYRLYDGRIVQIGMGWCKTACCAASGNGCGVTCTPGGSGLAPGCRDVYSAGFNGSQTALGPRSVMNAYTGVIGTFSSTTGDAIYRRLQIKEDELRTANFPGAIYFIEGQYIATDDTAWGNNLNNASYKRVTVDASFNLTPAGSMAIGKPAIYAWREHGLGVGIVDPSVTIVNADVPGEGRFVLGAKATALGNGRWRYDYAIYNLTSDRCLGSLSVPLPAGAEAQGFFFAGIPHHSGEPYVFAPWTSGAAGGAVTFATTQTFAQNPNINALRWGMMYNYSFVANAVPGNGPLTLGLFKPGTPASFDVSATSPGTTCWADWDRSGVVLPADVSAYVNSWHASVTGGTLEADVDGDGQVRSADVSVFVGQWFGALAGAC